MRLKMARDNMHRAMDRYLSLRAEFAEQRRQAEDVN